MRTQCSVITWIELLMGSAIDGSIGRSSLPLRELYVPAIAKMLLTGAGDLKKNDLSCASMSENEISTLLDRHMRAARISGNTSDIISWFLQPLIPRNPEESRDSVEPDFLFTWGLYPSRDERCLIVEAKRLRGAGRSLAGDYVDEGVMRFVDGRYGRGHDYGIMMGYVVVAPIPTVISRVSAAMNQRKTKTQQRSAFAPENSLCAHPETHHSTHLQQETLQPITLVHIFIDFT